MKLRIGGTDEWLGVAVGLCEKAVDGGLQIGDGPEDTAVEVLPGELGEEAFKTMATDETARASRPSGWST